MPFTQPQDSNLNTLPIELNHRAVNLACQGNISEAIKLLKQAIEFAPKYSASYNNLGAVYSMAQQLKEAASAYEQALTLDPKLAKTHFNLANIYRQLNQPALAIKHLKQTLALEPDHHSATHILAATEGRTTTCAPATYIQQLFDQYAPTFEATLTETLHYQAPDCLRKLAEAHGINHANHALDLGCGTGLSGLAFQNMCKQITGVDLSPKMLALAQNKRIYQRLVCAEMTEFLTQNESAFDLFISADALIYLGDLTNLFTAIKQRASTPATFLFSIETSEKAPFILKNTGRYAHSIDYIKTLCTRFNFRIAAQQAIVLRKDMGCDIKGELFMLST